jgi:PIN domain nuclease of toxin-antitoxin system
VRYAVHGAGRVRMSEDFDELPEDIARALAHRVRLLPDTHAAPWPLTGDEHLSPRASQLLVDISSEVLLSAAVVWEVEIKRSLGKLEAPDGFADVLLDAGAVGLGVSLEHAQAIGSLPWHHRAPFDPMLVAQAGIEKAVIVSADAALRRYGVPMEW